MQQILDALLDMDWDNDHDLGWPPDPDPFDSPSYPDPDVWDSRHLISDEHLQEQIQVHGYVDGWICGDKGSSGEHTDKVQKSDTSEAYSRGSKFITIANTNTSASTDAAGSGEQRQIPTYELSSLAPQAGPSNRPLQRIEYTHYSTPASGGAYHGVIPHHKQLHRNQSNESSDLPKVRVCIFHYYMI